MRHHLQLSFDGIALVHVGDIIAAVLRNAPEHEDTPEHERTLIETRELARLYKLFADTVLKMLADDLKTTR